MNIYTLTNDKHSHLIEPFLHFWNKYTDNYPINIVGFSDIQVTDNANFISLGKQLPANQWSNGLIRLCQRIKDDYFILMLEDYWLHSYADLSNLDKFSAMMSDSILRFDLSGNRIGHPHNLINSIPGYAIIESVRTAKYMMSFQTGIWDKINLLNILRKNENPWQSEIEGTKRVYGTTLRVIGTNPAVIKYQPVWRSGKNQWRFDKFLSSDRDYIIDWLKRNGYGVRI